MKRTVDWVPIACLGGYDENTLTIVRKSLDAEKIPNAASGSVYWAVTVPPEFADAARELLAASAEIKSTALMILEGDGQPRGWDRTRGDFWRK